MATVNGTNYAKTQTVPRTLIHPSESGGRMRTWYDVYEAAALASGSTINVGSPLPKGARIWRMKMQFDALGASSTISVGVSGTVAKYIAATSTASAGSTEALKIDEFGAALAAATNIILTTAGAAITGTVKLFIEYSLD